MRFQDACSWRARKARVTPPNTIFSRAGHYIVFASLFFAGACTPQTIPLPGVTSENEWHSFQGSWSASGTRQTLDLETHHQASIFDLTGSLVLTGDRGLGVGFRAKAIGFTDSLTGMQGRCVWTDERGDKVYSELKGEMIGPGNRITGRFLGGTGRFAGLTGEYSFEWRYVVETDGGSLSGRAINLMGRVRFDSTVVPSTGAHKQ
jgi:hypothetical protein